ncbi:hypothetical protein GGR50DRAFT_668571 [Xylaria sp. CBS 124048]|nr:hypothetical protein GGR50DRAFT_668571 [Xylaria sp. CBS 124048]
MMTERKTGLLIRQRGRQVFRTKLALPACLLACYCHPILCHPMPSYAILCHPIPSHPIPSPYAGCELDTSCTRCYIIYLILHGLYVKIPCDVVCCCCRSSCYSHLNL